MIQTILELDLADYPSEYGSGYDVYQFERHNRDHLEALTAGSYVRLRVGRSRPYPSCEFFRADLTWQIIAKDPYTLDEWRTMLEGVPVAQF
jgi:hypothetical protein